MISTLTWSFGRSPQPAGSFRRFAPGPHGGVRAVRGEGPALGAGGPSCTELVLSRLLLHFGGLAETGFLGRGGFWVFLRSLGGALARLEALHRLRNT